MQPGLLQRYAAFTEDPSGGSPAGVVLDAADMAAEEMQRLAAEVGYSETAFVTRAGAAGGDMDVRYFSPEAEVPFCGHATIATAVALAERGGAGTMTMHTRAGLVQVETEAAGDAFAATLTSVTPSVDAATDADLAELLAALGWAHEDLDDALPPRVAYAGAFHPIISARTRERLAALDYDFDRLRALMAARDWTTIQLVHRESANVFHARDPFPPGGVVEDPATGAAAAAFGAYLRALALVDPPARVTIHQGEDLGRPSLLTVDIPAGEGTGIRVTGRAVALS